MKIKRIDVAWVTATNAKKTRDFFVEKIGLKLSSAAEEYNWYELSGHEGGAVLGIGEDSERRGPVGPGQNALITMTVDDIEAAKKELMQKQVAILGDIIDVPGHVRMLFFKDPDGSLFQLVQDWNAA